MTIKRQQFAPAGAPDLPAEVDLLIQRALAVPSLALAPGAVAMLAGQPPDVMFEARRMFFMSGAVDMPAFDRALEKALATQETAAASGWFRAAHLDGRPVPARQWLVPGLVPGATVTLLAGDGGTGKSLVALQLAAAVAAGTAWLGRTVASGRAVYLSAEDDRAELHRRLMDVAAAAGVDLADLGRLTLRSLAGEDALLAVQSERGGELEPTALHDDLDDQLTVSAHLTPCSAIGSVQ